MLTEEQIEKGYEIFVKQGSYYWVNNYINRIDWEHGDMPVSHWMKVQKEQPYDWFENINFINFLRHLYGTKSV